MTIQDDSDTIDLIRNLCKTAAQRARARFSPQVASTRRQTDPQIMILDTVEDARLAAKIMRSEYADVPIRLTWWTQPPDPLARVHGDSYTPDDLLRLFVCPVCRKVSHNPNDLAHGWCGNCKRQTAAPRAPD